MALYKFCNIIIIIIIKLLSLQTMHLFGVNSEKLTSESFCFTMTVRHPSIFFTMTILSSPRELLRDAVAANTK